MIWEDCLSPKYEPLLVFKIFKTSFIFLWFFAVFCLEVKTGFNFLCLLSTPQDNFSPLEWHPRMYIVQCTLVQYSIYLRVAEPVYAESLSVRKTTIFRAFSSQCWAPRTYFSFLRHTYLCGVPDLHLMPCFGGFFIMRVLIRQKMGKTGFTSVSWNFKKWPSTAGCSKIKFLKTISVSSHMILYVCIFIYSHNQWPT